MSYLAKLTVHAEKEAAELFFDLFAVFFDGWSGGDRHHVALIA